MDRKSGPTFRKWQISAAFIVGILTLVSGAVPASAESSIDWSDGTTSASTPQQSAQPAPSARSTPGSTEFERAISEGASSPAQPPAAGRVSAADVTEPTVATRPKKTSLYHVKGVEVYISLPAPKGKDLRRQAIAEGQKIAFWHLMKRMVTVSERVRNLKNLRRASRFVKGMVRRAVVRERRLPDGSAILYTVDVQFDPKQVRGVMARYRLTYNEIAYPPVLIIGRTRSGRPMEWTHILEEEAVRFGLPLKRPINDMEDVMNLSWDKVMAGDKRVAGWARKRYGASRTWAVSTDFNIPSSTSVDEEEGWEPRLYEATARLVVNGTSGRRRLVGKAHGYYSDADEARTCLRRSLARQLLSRVMDGWIQSHAINPELRHLVAVRVRFGSELEPYAAFVKALRRISGVMQVRYPELRANEALLTVDYQGTDDTFIRALNGLGLPIRVDHYAQEIQVRIL
ncbi:MAG: DUF2066 domain-containing protein [Magnetococcales bacterium]|nr:DUF2066 domain-containing protein [Magnetococcales bacterium]